MIKVAMIKRVITHIKWVNNNNIINGEGYRS